MPDFRNSRVGDTAWTRVTDDAIIILKTDDRVYFKSVKAELTTDSSMDGYLHENDYMPSAFHSKPFWTDPPPPKRRVKKWVGMIQWPKDVTLIKSNFNGVTKLFESRDALLLEYPAAIPVEVEVEA